MTIKGAFNQEAEALGMEADSRAIKRADDEGMIVRPK
jgi:hypothetical protein